MPDWIRSNQAHKARFRTIERKAAYLSDGELGRALEAAQSRADDVAFAAYEEEWDFRNA